MPPKEEGSAPTDRDCRALVSDVTNDSNGPISCDLMLGPTPGPVPSTPVIRDTTDGALYKLRCMLGISISVRCNATAGEWSRDDGESGFGFGAGCFGATSNRIGSIGGNQSVV